MSWLLDFPGELLQAKGYIWLYIPRLVLIRIQTHKYRKLCRVNILWNRHIFNFSTCFFPRLLKITVLDQPTLDNVRRWWSVAVTVSCWLLAIGTSMALQRHFNDTLTALQRNLNNTSMSHKNANLNNIFWSFIIFL